MRFHILLAVAVSGYFVALHHPLFAATVYSTLFDRMSDQEDDNGFPDHWTRKRGFEDGLAFPSHLSIGIAENPNPFSNYCLRFAMEGGGGAVFSPKIPVKIGMTYTVSAYATAKKLQFDEVFIQAAFNTNPPKYIRSVRTALAETGWTQITTGPIVAESDAMTIGLFVVPKNKTGRHDYGATADFTNLEVKEEPTVKLETAANSHFFFSPRDVSIRCTIQGFNPADTAVNFQLEDPLGRIIVRKDENLMIGNYTADRFIKSKRNEGGVLTGVAMWNNLPIHSPGFYRVRINNGTSSAANQVSFTVMSRGHFFPDGSFGWDLSDWTAKDIETHFVHLAQSGLSAIKFDPRVVETNVNILSRLAAEQIHLIGVTNGLTGKIEAQSWADALQPVLQKTSLSVRDWQWSPDNASIADLFFNPDGKTTPDGLVRLQALRQLFDPHQFHYGIGIAWNYNYELPQVPALPDIFFTFPADHTLPPEDVLRYFSRQQKTTSSNRFYVSVQPLAKDNYVLPARINEFVQQLVLLKVSGVNGIFLTGIKDAQCGVLNADGSPTEMYLPWRTAAMLLSDLPYIGSLTLPNRSQNYVFGKDEQYVCVLWGASGTNETLYLGDNVSLTDVWGKTMLPEGLENQQVIPVSPQPVFVSGLNPAAIQCRLGLKTGIQQISALPNQKHRIPFRFTNPLPQSVSVAISPKPPRDEDWKIEPPTVVLMLEAGASADSAFDLTLMPRGNTGKQTFRYDIEFRGQSSSSLSPFSAFDEIQIGNPDVYMEFTSRLNEKDELEIIQTFYNNTQTELTYDCRLTVPSRPLMKSRLLHLGFGRYEHVYTLRRGSELLKTKTGTPMTLKAVPADGGAASEPLVYTIPLSDDL